MCPTAGLRTTKSLPHGIDVARAWTSGCAVHSIGGRFILVEPSPQATWFAVLVFCDERRRLEIIYLAEPLRDPLQPGQLLASLHPSPIAAN